MRMKNGCDDSVRGRVKDLEKLGVVVMYIDCVSVFQHCIPYPFGRADNTIFNFDSSSQNYE